MRWGCVVAAGGRETGTLARAMGTERKALCEFEGRPSIAWVLDAIRDAGIGACATVSGEDVRPAVHFGAFVSETGGAVDNVAAGLASIRDRCDALLFLPSDAPGLTKAALTQFMASVEERAATGNWLAIGLCSLTAFAAAFPEVPAGALRLREGRFVSGALYAGTPAAFESCLERIRQLRKSRKSQLGMVAQIGLGSAIRFVLGLVDHATAEKKLSQVAGASVILVLDSDPVMALDFDDIQELEALRRCFHRIVR